MKKQVARRWWISGVVQGVGFRFAVQHKAAALGLSGWARNSSDGRVEVYAVGSAERLDNLGAYLYIGPRGADVRGVEQLEESEVEAASGFRIR